MYNSHIVRLFVFFSKHHFKISIYDINCKQYSGSCTILVYLPDPIAPVKSAIIVSIPMHIPPHADAVGM